MLIYLSLGQLGLDRRPSLTLRGITKQIHDDGALRDSLVHVEQICARDPAILLGLLPRSSILPNTNDDIQAIIT